MMLLPPVLNPTGGLASAVKEMNHSKVHIAAIPTSLRISLCRGNRIYCVHCPLSQRLKIPLFLQDTFRKTWSVHAFP